MRSRITMTFDPNKEYNAYKLTIRLTTIMGDTASAEYSSKKEMFEAYRDTIIYWSPRLYSCQKRQKPLEILTHNI